MAPEESYDGSPALVDDYRCLLYEPDIDAPAWIEGYDFVPDQLWGIAR